MNIHETPKEIASTLARWAPRRISCLLDPSVGTGALIAPLVSRLLHNESRVFCVDINQDVLQIVKHKYEGEIGSSMTLINQDFLQVNFRRYLKGRHNFDCIIMNPPFAGRREYLEKVSPFNCKNDLYLFDKMAPVEGAFLIRAVQLLETGGRILAVLPSSIIASSTAKWIREFLLSNGNILCVHELPPFTFKKVEARIYLLVFEKKVSRKKVILRNHKLVSPDELLLLKESLCREKRLDYGFQTSRLWFDRLRSEIAEAGWTSLSNYAELTRGRADSPQGIQKAIHSTDYYKGFWSLARLKKKRHVRQMYDALKHTDLLMTRVGRQSTDSIGAIIGSAPLAWTDCVIRIRPKNERYRIRLLFALRCLLVCEDGRNFVQRGSSAKYVVQSELESLLIPWDMADMYPKVFSKYKTAVARHQFHRMRSLENFVQRMLRKRLKSHC